MRSYLGALSALPIVIFLLLVGCSSSEPVKIGFVGGITGEFADHGIAGRDGSRMAIEWANSEGGINGRPIELLIRDDHNDPKIAQQVDIELIDAGVVAIIGHMTDAMSVAAAPVVTQRKVVMISPTAGSEELIKQDDYFLRIYPTHAETALRFAEAAYKQLRLRRLTLIYNKDGQDSEGWVKKFQSAFVALGGKVTWRHGYQNGSPVLMAQIARRIKRHRGDGVMIFASAIDTAQLSQQLLRLKVRRKLLASSWAASNDLISQGGAAVEGLTLFNTVDQADKGSSYQRFLKNFRDLYGYVPSAAAVHAFDATQVVIAGLSKLIDSAMLKPTLLKQKRFDLLQSSIEFDAYGDVSRSPFLLQIKGGRFKRL